MADSDLVDCVLPDFRQALKDCEALYHACAREAVRSHPGLITGSKKEFVARMRDLHHGLLLKVFAEVAHVDWHWSPEEQALGGVLFEHVWGTRVPVEKLKDALEGIRRQNDLTWSAWLNPFTWLPPFRERSDQLETLVLRLANLVAKADGRVKPAESRRLAELQTELAQSLQPTASAQAPGAAGGKVEQGYAIKTLPGGAPVKADDILDRDVEVRVSEEALAAVLAELDQLIGLDIVKHEVRGLVNFLKIQKARADFSLPETKITLHAVFRGNPGTGKTTVARLLGRVFGAMGILAKGHLIETDRSGLVAEYAGQTGPKTHKRIDEALGGLLFIDEAYSLVAERGDDPYGAEAVQALLKRMEDDRDRLIVILAGYPQPLDRLLRSNPGLSSRFSRQFTFPDYTAVELGRIFESFCQRNRYELSPLTRVKLLLGFTHLVGERDEHFGNGRVARHVFESAIRRLANRIAALAPLTHELLTRLEPDDIAMDGVPPSVWADLASAERTFRATCPACSQSSRLKHDLLGQTVRCPRCDKSFFCDWGEVLGSNPDPQT